MSRDLIQILTDKGFNGADIHYFMLRFDIGIEIPLPLNRLQMHDIWYDRYHQTREPEEQQRRWEEHYEKQAQKAREKWDAALVAADFEKPK